MTRIKAIIFDMDGLLVDSEPLSKRVWRSLLAEYGHDLDKETERSILGFRADESARFICDRYNLKESVNQLVQKRREMLLALINSDLHPMPGLEILFDALDGYNLLLGVATSSDQHIAQAILRSIGVYHKLTAVISGDMVERGKPAPDIYLAAASALDLPPSACLALEDSPKGVQAARAAGMRCVVIPDEATAGLNITGANFKFSSLGQVAEKLDFLLNAQ